VTPLRALGIIALLMSPAFGQTLRPEFEVASVKLVDPPMGPHAVGLRIDHGRATIEGATLRQIITQAYVVQRVLVMGGPNWYDSDQYTVIAKTEGPNATREGARAMLQTLLADRFKLAVHRETKEITAYTLSVAKNGPILNAAKADELVTAGRDGGGVIQLHNQPMIGFVNLLASIRDLPVLDGTGLTGHYNFALDWNQDPTSPSLFTAVREQLGLELKAQKSPVEVLLVDYAERPSEN
jgi:uncharacterized protein (TIGR03435 family)